MALVALGASVHHFTGAIPGVLVTGLRIRANQIAAAGCNNIPQNHSKTPQNRKPTFAFGEIEISRSALFAVPAAKVGLALADALQGGALLIESAVEETVAGLAVRVVVVAEAAAVAVGRRELFAALAAPRAFHAVASEREIDTLAACSQKSPAVE